MRAYRASAGADLLHNNLGGLGCYNPYANGGQGGGCDNSLDSGICDGEKIDGPCSTKMSTRVTSKPPSELSLSDPLSLPAVIGNVTDSATVARVGGIVDLEISNMSEYIPYVRTDAAPNLRNRCAPAARASLLTGVALTSPS